MDLRSSRHFCYNSCGDTRMRLRVSVFSLLRRFSVLLLPIVAGTVLSLPQAAAAQTLAEAVEIDSALPPIRFPISGRKCLDPAAPSFPCATAIATICAKPSASPISNSSVSTQFFRMKSECTTKMPLGNPVYNFYYVDQIYDRPASKIRCAPSWK